MSKKKASQPARGSVADANAEKITALQKRNRILEGNCDVFKTEIDHMLVELDTVGKLLIEANAQSEDRRRLLTQRRITIGTLEDDKRKLSDRLNRQGGMV